jgi:hypothetical protein
VDSSAGLGMIPLQAVQPITNHFTGYNIRPNYFLVYPMDPILPHFTQTALPPIYSAALVGNLENFRSISHLPLVPQGGTHTAHWTGGWVASRDGFEKKKISLLCHESNHEPSNPWSSHFTDNAIPSPLRHIMHIRKNHIMNSLSHRKWWTRWKQNLLNRGEREHATYLTLQVG